MTMACVHDMSSGWEETAGHCLRSWSFITVCFRVRLHEQMIYESEDLEAFNIFRLEFLGEQKHIWGTLGYRLKYSYSYSICIDLFIWFVATSESRKFRYNVPPSSKTITQSSHRQEIKVGQNSSISLPWLCLLNNARHFCSRLSYAQILLCLHYCAPRILYSSPAGCDSCLRTFYHLPTLSSISLYHRGIQRE